MLSELHGLETLDLEDNELGAEDGGAGAIGQSLTSLSRLQCLNVAQCRLSHLPSIVERLCTASAFWTSPTTGRHSHPRQRSLFVHCLVDAACLCRCNRSHSRLGCRSHPTFSLLICTVSLTLLIEKQLQQVLLNFW